MKDMTYKGFTGSIEASLEDDCLTGQIQFIDDIVTYEGQTIAEIKVAFEAAIDRYLDYCARHNKSPSKPCSGSFNVRIGHTLHREATVAARALKVSLNEFVTQAVANELAGNANVRPAAVSRSWGQITPGNTETSPSPQTGAYGTVGAVGNVRFGNITSYAKNTVQ